jgi:hydrogenase/urease accessory protein HupE
VRRDSPMTRFLVCFAAILWSAAPAQAHPAPFSYLDVHLQPARIHVTLAVHVLDVAHDLRLPEAQLADPRHRDALVALLRGRIRIAADGRDLTGGTWSAPEAIPDRHALKLEASYPLDRPPGVLSLTTVMFPYDPAHQTFVNVYDAGTLVQQAILTPARQRVEYFSGTRQGSLAVIRRFLPSGVHHILIGPDHLLFLIGLMLLGGSLRQLVLVVSAFTLAHSVTLSLAALDIVSPPAWIIEPAIALSIVYVGADNLTVRDGRDVRVWIAFAFGLIHGFGFANVLREMELPARALGWSLFAFNLGVEVGQVAVVLVVASLLAMVRRRSEVLARWLAVAGSVVVIAAGVFWFVERVFIEGAV